MFFKNIPDKQGLVFTFLENETSVILNTIVLRVMHALDAGAGVQLDRERWCEGSIK